MELRSKKDASLQGVYAAMSAKKTALIIGAGPAGLTAAYELLKRTDITPVVIEQDAAYVGGISRTVNYKGNRIDIGGHRFFSKSDRIMQWWAEMLPVAFPKTKEASITYQRSVRSLTEGLTRATDENGIEVMNVRPRKTRIIHGGTFFVYPVELSLDTLFKLGPIQTARIIYTYLLAVLFPIRPEKTLEEFFINRFGRELYHTFFKTYTEKVWGTSCTHMSAEWGAQRVKGLSLVKAAAHALKKMVRIGPLAGKGVETSLIEQFLYPTYGPGQLWEKVATRVKELGGEVRMGTAVVGISLDDTHRIHSVSIQNGSGQEEIPADYVFSSTDIRSLIHMLGSDVPSEVQHVAQGLEYRDFVTVGLLLKERPREKNGEPLSDTWMYVHEDNVKVGRVQLFHNWHPLLVADQKHGWVGLEYFCNEHDGLWNMADAELITLASEELEKIGLRRGIEVIDGTVIRQLKAYPGYSGSYGRFDEIRTYLDSIPNLFPVGRNGMHRYNNQDHSMLAAMTAVDLTIAGANEKSTLWNVNTEQAYHEEK